MVNNVRGVGVRDQGGGVGGVPISTARFFTVLEYVALY